MCTLDVMPKGATWIGHEHKMNLVYNIWSYTDIINRFEQAKKKKITKSDKTYLLVPNQIKFNKTKDHPLPRNPTIKIPEEERSLLSKLEAGLKQSNRYSGLTETLCGTWNMYRQAYQNRSSQMH